jgi:hypothetical protein
MLGGDAESAVSRDHARELLAAAEVEVPTKKSRAKAAK